MKCKFCGKPVTLAPSAAERAKKFGESSEYYIRAFPYHTDCFIAHRSKQSIQLMRSINGSENGDHS